MELNFNIDIQDGCIIKYTYGIELEKEDMHCTFTACTIGEIKRRK